jgi:hypothetical protein
VTSGRPCPSGTMKMIFFAFLGPFLLGCFAIAEVIINEQLKIIENSIIIIFLAIFNCYLSFTIEWLINQGYKTYEPNENNIHLLS